MCIVSQNSMSGQPSYLFLILISVFVNSFFVEWHLSKHFYSISFSPVVNAAHTFYNGTTTLPISEEDRTPRKRISKTLNMTTNPEEKRKIIGDTFVKVGQGYLHACLSISMFIDIFFSKYTIYPTYLCIASSIYLPFSLHAYPSANLFTWFSALF